MGKQIAALVAIFLCTAAAWAILGATIFARTYSKDDGLSARVASTWGGPQVQSPPSATAATRVTKLVRENVNGRDVEKSVQEVVQTPLPLEQSRVKADLNLEQRQKGLLWFATYRVAFEGEYLFHNRSASDDVRLMLTFPAPQAIYDDLRFEVDGKPVPTFTERGAVVASIRRPPGSVIRLKVGYRSQGLSTWHYSFGENVSQVRDFVLEMNTDFAAIDFPNGTMSPTEKSRHGRGWRLVWRYRNLVSGYQIGMVMPEKLQPGPLAGRISFFAPVSLLFFFFMMFIITRMRGIALHPMHYFFLATSFFSFHLLLAYLADLISIHIAFAICSAVSVFLVVSYLGIVAGPRFALVEAGLAQLVYLVGFSYAFFFEGLTGLTVTIGAILSLFLVMQLTARIDWRRSDALAARVEG